MVVLTLQSISAKKWWKHNDPPFQTNKINCQLSCTCQSIITKHYMPKKLCSKFTITEEYLTKKLSSKAGVQVQNPRVDLHKTWVDKTKATLLFRTNVGFLKGLRLTKKLLMTGKFSPNNRNPIFTWDSAKVHKPKLMHAYQRASARDVEGKTAGLTTCFDLFKRTVTETPSKPAITNGIHHWIKEKRNLGKHTACADS